MAKTFYQSSGPKILGYAFAGITAVLLIVDVAIITYTVTRATKFVHTTGTIIDAVVQRGSRSSNSKGMYAKVVEYHDRDQRRHTWESSVYSSRSPRYGTKVPLAYNPENPDDAILLAPMDVLFLPVLLTAFVLLFGFFAVFTLRMHFKNEARIRQLLHSGNLITAKIVEITPDQTTIINGKNPWLIHARAQVGKKQLTFVSDAVRYDPETAFPDGTIPVYVDPGDPRNYYVDTRTAAGGASFSAQ